jgi:hypothetical protein
MSGWGVSAHEGRAWILEAHFDCVVVNGVDTETDTNEDEHSAPTQVI